MLAQETETGGNKASANRRHLTGYRANNARPHLLLSPRSSVATNIVTTGGRGERGEAPPLVSDWGTPTDRLGHGHDTVNDVAARTHARSVKDNENRSRQVLSN